MDTIERRTPTTSYKRFQLRRMCGALGAEITGVDLAKPMDEELRAELNSAFLEHLVLCFPKQTLTNDQQIAFTKSFGEIQPHPLYRSAEMEGYRDILVLEHKEGQFFNGRNDVWHTDMTFKEVPPKLGMLYCRAVDEGFGDTMFCNMYKAYESLSPGLRATLDPLKAVHSAAQLQRRNNAKSYNIPIKEIPPPVIHPVIRTHPETGRRALFVNPSFVTNFVDMTEEESGALLEYLHAHAIRNEHCYRHRWNVDDVVMWDQRATMHYVVIDYDPGMHRRMHRTTVAGDRPF
jgi:taurine dioxygenase